MSNLVSETIGLTEAGTVVCIDLQMSLFAISDKAPQIIEACECVFVYLVIPIVKYADSLCSYLILEQCGLVQNIANRR